MITKRLHWGLAAGLLGVGACQDREPVCDEAHPTASPQCQPAWAADNSLPVRMSLRGLGDPTQPLKVTLARVRTWHAFRLDVVPSATPSPDCPGAVDGGAELNVVQSNQAGTVELPLPPALKDGKLGPARWVLRECKTGFRYEQPVRIYDPPQFQAPIRVTDQSPGPGVTVQRYIGVDLDDTSVFAHEEIAAPGAYRRLAVLDVDGKKKAKPEPPQDAYLTVLTERQIAVSKGAAGLFARLPARGLTDDLRLVPFMGTGHAMPPLESGTTYLRSDARSDRLARVSGSQLTLEQATLSTSGPPAISFQKLASCDVSGVQIEALVVAEGHSGGLPPPTAPDAASARSPTMALVLGTQDMRRSVSVCYAPGDGVGADTSKAQAAAAACFQEALSAGAGALSPHIALSDLDGDGLLDLLVAPSDPRQPLLYVPAQEGGPPCQAVALPTLPQPSDSPVTGLATGGVLGAKISEVTLPGVVLSTATDLRRLDRKAP